jgi:TolB-like protein/DNA-binding winged helix-turn-helix (wHTH) protein
MSGQGPPSIYEFGGFELDVTQRLLRSKEGRPVPLTPRVFEALSYLVAHNGQLIEKSALLEAVWPRVVVEEGSLSQAIYELRRALGERPDEHRFIVTVPGRGYQFVAEVTHRERPSTNMAEAQPPGVAPQLATRHEAASRPHLRYVVAAFAIAAGIMVAWYVIDTRPFGPSARQMGIAPTNVASVAVLPFVDLSPQRDQQHLSEGLSEELIHLLAQNPSLRVLPRTSSFSFKSQPFDVPKIASKLGATHIIEGSVRKGSERVRIAVKLIDAATSSHVWSQTYDRNVEDAIAIQQEIASAVATALNAALARDGPAKATTANLRAYEHFLLARFFFARRQLGDLRRAEQEYRRALELDPAFARAWVGLSGVYYVSLDRYVDFGMSRAQALERMRDAVDRALELDPKLAEAHVRRAMYQLEAGDREGGGEHARRAAALEPNNPVVLFWLSEIALSEGRLEDAVEFQSGAVRHDPLAPVPRANLGTILYFAGRFDEAEPELRRALQIAGAPDAAWGNPNDPSSAAGISLAKVLIAQRRYDEAFNLIQSWPPGQLRDSCLAQVHHARGEDREADAALKRLVASATAEPHWIAETYAHRGEVDQAFRWLTIAADRSRERHDGRQTWRMDIRYSPFVTSLHRDRRWKAWLAERDSYGR